MIIDFCARLLTQTVWVCLFLAQLTTKHKAKLDDYLQRQATPGGQRALSIAGFQS